MDDPPGQQAEVGGREGAGGRRPHPRQRLLREIPGNKNMHDYVFFNTILVVRNLILGSQHYLFCF